MTSTCKSFKTITRSKHLWKTLCQLQNPGSYLSFELLISQQTPDVDKQGLAWQRLYRFQYQGIELPWKEIFKVGKPSWIGLDVCDHIAVLPNGNIVTSGTMSGHAGAIWSSTGQLISKLLPDAICFKKIIVLPNGNFVTCNENLPNKQDFIVRIWDPSGKVLANLEGHTAAPTDIALLPNEIIVTVAEDGLICMWSFAGQHIKTIIGHARGINSVAVLPGGGFVTGSPDCTAVIWSDDGQKIVTLTGHTGPIEWVAALPNGCIVTKAGGQDERGGLWSPDGQLLKYFPRYIIGKIAIMPNGGFVTTWHKTARIWSEDGELLSELNGHKNFIWSMEVLPDGRIVTASHDRFVRIWSPTGKPLLILRVWHEIWCVKLLPNGNIFTGGRDGKLCLHSVKTDVLMQEAIPSQRAACAIS